MKNKIVLIINLLLVFAFISNVPLLAQVSDLCHTT